MGRVWIDTFAKLLTHIHTTLFHERCGIMRTRNSSLAALVAVLAFGLLSVAGVAAQSDYPLQFTDSRDRTITLHSAPERIISLAPSVTETIFAIGAGERLVGRTEFCNYPPAAQEVPTVGNLQNPNVERMVSLQPNLVIASNHFTRQALGNLERAGITVAIVYGGESFEEVYRAIRNIGTLVDASKGAAEVVSDMQETVEMVTERVEGEPRPDVYYVIGFGETGDYTAGGNTFVGRMIEMAGGDNIASDLDGWAYSLERVVAGNPDIVICSEHWGVPEQLRQAHGYKELEAIREGRLRPVNNNMIDRPGPRLAQGLRELAAAIHPELF
jgi:iron complex transport system substrate-binding protein